MSKQKRPVADIQQDYSQVCARLGHVEYQSYIHNRDAEKLKKELEDLNLEAAASAAEDAEIKAQEQPEQKSE